MTKISVLRTNISRRLVGVVAALISAVLLTGVSGCATKPPVAASAAALAAPDCSRLGGWGGHPAQYAYQVLGETPEAKNFEIYPCGQTVMRNPMTGYGVPVMPCKGVPGPLCFEDRLEGAETSRLFFVIPRNFDGRADKWTQEGVEFMAMPVSWNEGRDIVVITAQRLSGTRHPGIQRFVFSVRDGMLTAIVGDGLSADTRIYVLEGHGGIFANHGEGSFALNRK